MWLLLCRPRSMDDQTSQLLDELRRNQAMAPAVDPHDIEACEALLESYFMQVWPTPDPGAHAALPLCMASSNLTDSFCFSSLGSWQKGALSGRHGVLPGPSGTTSVLSAANCCKLRRAACRSGLLWGSIGTACDG